MAGGEEGVAFTVSHEGLEARYVLKPDDSPIRIGRDPENDIVVENRGVSKFHAELRLPSKAGAGAGAATYVCALDLSMNGTAVLVPGGKGPSSLKRGEEAPLPNGAELLMPWLQKVKGPPVHLERVSFKVHYDAPVLSPTDAGEEEVQPAAPQPDSSGAGREPAAVGKAAEPSAKLGHHPSRTVAPPQASSLALQLRQPKQVPTDSQRQRQPLQKRAADGLPNGHSAVPAGLGKDKAEPQVETRKDKHAGSGLVADEGAAHLRFVEMLLNSQVSTLTTYEDARRRLGSEPEWQALEDDKRRMLFETFQLRVGTAQTEIKSKNRGKKQRLLEEAPEEPRRERLAVADAPCAPALASSGGPDAAAKGLSVPPPPPRATGRRATAAAPAAAAANAALARPEPPPPPVPWPSAQEAAARRRPQRLELPAEAAVVVKSDPESPSRARSPPCARRRGAAPHRAAAPEPSPLRRRPREAPRGGTLLADKPKRRRMAADTSRRNEFSSTEHKVMPRSESEETFSDPGPKRAGVKVEGHAVSSGPLVKLETAEAVARGATDASLLDRARNAAPGGIVRGPPVPPAPPERPARRVMVRNDASPDRMAQELRISLPMHTASMSGAWPSGVQAPPPRPQPQSSEWLRWQAQAGEPAPAPALLPARDTVREDIDDSDDVRTTCAGPVVLRPRARTAAAAPPAALEAAPPARAAALRPAAVEEAPRSSPDPPEATRVVLLPRRSIEGALPAPPAATPVYREALSDVQARRLEAALLERAALLAR